MAAKTKETKSATSSKKRKRGGVGLMDVYKSYEERTVPHDNSSSSDIPNLEEISEDNPDISDRNIDDLEDKKKKMLSESQVPKTKAAKKRTLKKKKIETLAENITDKLEKTLLRKRFKRRIRGEDFEQVTVIFDAQIYKDLDQRLEELSSTGRGVKISRSMLIRALVRHFLNGGSGSDMNFEGLFTPDPRSPEEMDLIESALVERLG